MQWSAAQSGMSGET